MSITTWCQHCGANDVRNEYIFKPSIRTRSSTADNAAERGRRTLVSADRHRHQTKVNGDRRRVTDGTS